MPQGKPAGVRCVQLSDDNLCSIFGSDQRPAVCGSLQPGEEMCGDSAVEAMDRITEWEDETRPE
jgi:hypothetical protein